MKYSSGRLGENVKSPKPNSFTKNGAGFGSLQLPLVFSARNTSVSRVLGAASKRGWGLTLIRELMDEVQIRSNPGKTLVRMRKYVENAP